MQNNFVHDNKHRFINDEPCNLIPTIEQQQSRTINQHLNFNLNSIKTVP